MRDAVATAEALLRARFAEHQEVVRELQDEIPMITRIAETIRGALTSGHKVLAFGNGGSAAAAEHLAAELVGRFKLDRRACPAIALSGSSSTVTALANDYGYADVFARQIEAFGDAGDVAIGLTTSGKSVNVVRALAAAGAGGLTTVCLTGEAGVAAPHVDLVLRVPSGDTARVQEAHSLVIHGVCELVEREGLR